MHASNGGLANLSVRPRSLDAKPHFSGLATSFALAMGYPQQRLGAPINIVFVHAKLAQAKRAGHGLGVGLHEGWGGNGDWALWAATGPEGKKPVQIRCELALPPREFAAR